MIQTRPKELLELSVERCCRVLCISRAAYYKPARKFSERELDLVRQTLALKVIFPTCGYRTVAANLGLSFKSARSLMRRHGLQAGRSRPKDRSRVVRIPSDANLMLQAELTLPSRTFAADVTHIRLRSGAAYVASILDVCTRQIVGWAISKSNDTALVSAALSKLLSSRPLLQGWIHHSDRGSNYSSDAYIELVRDWGGISSFSDPGSPTQNAYAESFFSTFKREEAGKEVYTNLQDAENAISAYILLYNSMRLHSSVGWKTPDQYYAEISSH